MHTINLYLFIGTVCEKVKVSQVHTNSETG